MNYRILGETGLKVSEIGFGAWGIGGDSYGDVDDRVSEEALRKAFELGINFFDTSDLYGAGHSEEIIGRVFKSQRESVILATKGGMLPHKGFFMPQDFSNKHLRKALENSLIRLNTEYMDLYQLHSPLPEVISDPRIKDFLETLKSEGKILHYGVSCRSPKDALNAVADAGYKSIQVNYNLIDQRAKETGLIDTCRSANAGFICRTPLCFGYLTGNLRGTEEHKSNDHRANWPVEQRKRWAEAPGLFDKLISDLGISNTQFALKFCLKDSAVSTVIPGMITPAEVIENASVAQLPEIPESIMQEIQLIYSSHVFYDNKIKSQQSN